MPLNTTVTPSKRADDDDDIQFISSKPVKRRRISDQNRQPEGQPQFAFFTPPAAFTNPIATPPAFAPGFAPIPAPVLFPIPPPPQTPHLSKEETQISERRLSTGMVGLPSDFHAVELSYGLRGVSLPVLENFVLNQPPRGPRPISPPELSPKQLPQTITPVILNMPISNSSAPAFVPQETTNRHIEGSKANNNAKQTTPQQEHGTLDSGLNQMNILNTPIARLSSSSKRRETPKISDETSTASMPPPPVPRPEQSQAHSSMPKCSNNLEQINWNAPQHGNSKQPCHICSRMRQQANLARAQGIPMMPPNIPPAHHQFIPQMPCHQAYGQHLQPHMMGMSPSGMHPFAPGFPMMMPIQGNNFPNMTTPYHHAASPSPTTEAAAHQNSGMQPSWQQLSRKQDSPVAVTRSPTTTSTPIPTPIPTITPNINSITITAPTTAQQDESIRSPKPGATSTTSTPTFAPNTNTTATTATATAIATTQPPSSSPPSTITSTSTSTSPVKPGLPLSLIQPTYRKPSPNLIVDVAETCQERFPFEEVARRHNAPVDKVFDVFAAIIQVPLLRCPTDRRRTGKLATQRIREYAKARKDILLESSSSSRAASGGVGAGAGVGGHNSEQGVETGTGTGTPSAAGAGAGAGTGTGTGTGTAVITPLDVAQRMGTVDFPEGFDIGNTDG